MFQEKLKPCFWDEKKWEKRKNGDSDIKTGKAEIKQVVKRAGKNRASLIKNLYVPDSLDIKYSWHILSIIQWV